MAKIGTGAWTIAAVRGAIFDKDGTLIDSHAYWGEIIRRRAAALAEAASGGTALAARLVLAMGYDSLSGRLLPAGPIALKGRAEVIKAVSSAMGGQGRALSEEEIGRIFSDVHSGFSGEMRPFVRLLPGAVELLAALKAQNVPCALVTSDGAASTEEILEMLGLRKYFAAVLGRESAPGPKESGAPAVKAAGLLSLPPGEVICVGDAPADVEMAGRAGLKCALAVATGQVPLQALSGLTPYCAESLEELKVGPDA